MSRTMVPATDSRGRPVKGIYVRDGRYVAGLSIDGKWTTRTLEAATLTEARRERESLATGHREGRIATRSALTFDEAFAEWQDSREISPDTARRERNTLRLYLDDVRARRLQDVTSSDVARLLRELRRTHAEWTAVGAYRVLAGVFGLAVRRGILARNPLDGLARQERPKQVNARTVAVLDRAEMARLVAAGSTERDRAVIGLAGYAGLRAGEIRALRWADLDFDANAVRVSRAAVEDGTVKGPKTRAGVRSVPLLPELRRLLVAWRLRAPRTEPASLVIATAEGSLVASSNLRRALRSAIDAAGLEVDGERLSLHSLRHSFASFLVTELELPPTTAAEILGHSDPSTTLRLYARDGRDESAVVADVLERAAAGG